MSITVAKLKQLLARVPDDATVNAYEGEDVGIVICDCGPERHLGRTWWITARDTDDEDDQSEFEES
jgi:hypothetical protein